MTDYTLKAPSHLPDTSGALADISPEILLRAWLTYYSDDLQEDTATNHISRLSQWIKASARSAFMVTSYILHSHIPPSDSLGAFLALLRDTALGTSISGYESADATTVDEAYCVAPQLHSYLIAHFPELVFTDPSRALDSFDTLPSDEAVLLALRDSGFSQHRHADREKLGVIPLLLAGERRPCPTGSAASTLNKVDNLVICHGSSDLLFRWSCLPLRWRYYILRDTPFIAPRQSIAASVASDSTINVAALIDAILKPTVAISHALSDVSLSLDSVSCDKPLPDLSLQWYIKVFATSGVTCP